MLALTSKIKNFSRSNKIPVFFIELLLFYLLWNFLDGYLIAHSHLFDRIWMGMYHILLKSVMFMSVLITKIFTDVQITTTYRHIILGDFGSIGISNYCLCANLMFLFGAFIIAYPGKWKIKLWFIPLGIVIIHLLNTFRISALCLLKIYSPETLEINHHYIFNIILYAFVFIMWMIWITRLSGEGILKRKLSEGKE